MKKFLDFISEEISIKGNKGLPEEKIREIERKGAEKIAGAFPPELFNRMMTLMEQSRPFTRGNEKSLEELAESIIRDTFGIILSDVNLEIKLVGNGKEVKKFMQEEDKKKEEKNKKSEDEEEEDEEEEDNTDSEDEEELDPNAVKLAVDKRKILNNIIQGEAKNTKFILHSELSKDGLREIYGNRFQEIFNIWDEISKIADKMDWIIPINVKADMMERAPEGMAGACSVEQPKSKNKMSKKQKDIADEILKDLEEGNLDLNNEETQEKIKETLGVVKRTVRAVGVDFPMLLHEAVKGIYELLTDIALPREEKLAMEVHRQTSTFADEAEDFRYGPYLAQDLNNFIMKSPDIDKYPNIKEYVFAKLIDSERWTDEECLENLKNVFLESPSGRKLINDLVQETIEQLDEYHRSLRDWEESKMRSSEPKAELSEVEGEEGADDEIERLRQKTAERESDYSQMTQSELLSLIDDALDRGDFSEVKKISQFLKEGKEIFLREIERINENHSRRK
jgi:hypothetical protein